MVHLFTFFIWTIEILFTFCTQNIGDVYFLLWRIGDVYCLFTKEWRCLLSLFIEDLEMFTFLHTKDCFYIQKIVDKIYFLVYIESDTVSLYTKKGDTFYFLYTEDLRCCLLSVCEGVVVVYFTCCKGRTSSLFTFWMWRTGDLFI